MKLFCSRMLRAAKLDPNLYEEVEADEKALADALKVVLISSIAGGVGVLGYVNSWADMYRVILMHLSLWFFWAFMSYFVGSKLLPEPQTKTNPGELLRTLGFSSAPGIIRCLGVLPGLSTFVYHIVYPVSQIWMFAAMIVALRQALDYSSTWRAVAVCFIGWIIQAVGLAVFLAVAMEGQ